MEGFNFLSYVQTARKSFVVYFGKFPTVDENSSFDEQNTVKSVTKLFWATIQNCKRKQKAENFFLR